MKNELIITDNVDQISLEKVIDDCKSFFENELKTKINVFKTNNGFDLEYNGYELGSYGIRSSEFLDWIYATGCAEPRMSVIKNMIK